MQNLATKLGNGIGSIMDFIAIITSSAVAGLILFMVVTRYLLEWSIVGLDELALISAMWLYMTGAMIASRRAEHLVVDFLPQKITSPGLLRLHQRLVALIMLGTSVFFMYLAWKMLSFSLRRPQSTPGLNIPELIPQSAIIMASIGSFLYALRDLITGRPCHNPNETGED